MVSESGAGESSPRVHVSYASDSPEHQALVIDFITFLRGEAGVDARLDVWAGDIRRDRVAWTVEQFESSDFILVIASPEYGRLGDGVLAGLENALINNRIGRDLADATRRILPVLLPGRSAEEIPPALCAYSATYYPIHEFTLDGVRGLLRVLHGAPEHVMPPLGTFLPPVPGAEPILVVKDQQPPSPAPRLRAGCEAAIGGRRYLVHGDLFEERTTPDGAAVHRYARALRLGSPHQHVWLRQVEVRQETPTVATALAALTRERDLLAAPTGQRRGMPRLLELAEDAETTTLATAWPSSRSGGPCDTLDLFLPDPGEIPDGLRITGFLRALAGLCHLLAVMHDRNTPHRYLSPAGIFRHDDGRLALRDLGLAAAPFEPGEGPSAYRAPEQGRRRPGQVGPWTDVYQVAAVVYHLATGHSPTRSNPVPLRAFALALPPETAAAVDAGLATDTAGRPSVADLAVALERAG
ncbi:SEFIR domain-containing protein [Amycolatopsis sp. YIM 10]|uniref:SEFIR domain-containing protein n=1 Tax=Amycolatopsis sp. YIM 10 TaxID=2653857 RepID=UPI00128FFBE6|nr:SEFIR domain-containing protein [Amycolatopsis sp. YIM 10]QFU87529.1 Serine/threonine-protein kinase PknL [Amycolatopsis sp. YIM 10]